MSLDEALAEAVPDGAPLCRRLVHRRRLRRDVQLLGANALPPLRKGVPGSNKFRLSVHTPSIDTNFVPRHGT